MKITMNLPKPAEVRADSLRKGDAFVKNNTVFRLISSNPCHLKVRTVRKGLLPKVLVDNLSTATLGRFNRDAMVVPVNLELIVSVKE